jgi:hypothetical protein
MTDEASKKPSLEEAEIAHSIFQDIAKHAEDHRSEREGLSQNLQNYIFAPSPLEEQERKKIAELTAVCNAHTAAVEPLKARVDPSMDLLVLATLLVRNQDFLKELAEFEDSAGELADKGRPQLSMSLNTWKHDTEAANAMIQYVYHGHPGAKTQAGDRALQEVAATCPAGPVKPAAPVLTSQALFGIWDMTIPDGRQVELALDNGSFSYVLADGSYAYWGGWSLDAQPGNQPMLALTRGGGYPVAYYGPLATVPLTYATNEAWAITAFAPDKISFGNVVMTRRMSISPAAVCARISQVQVEYGAKDRRDRANAQSFIAQRNIISSAQDAMWEYINSGAGRPK